MFNTTTPNVLTFKNSQFGDLRVNQSEDGRIWFCLSDVCQSLSLGNASQTKSRLKAEGITINDTPTGSGIQQMLFVDEPNLYRCIFQSRKQEAEVFQDWVCEQVLPSIRKHGAYATSETIDSIIANPENGIKLLQALQKEREEKQRLENKNLILETENEHQQKQIARLQPKADFADMAFATDDKVDIGMSAKILKLGFGRNTLFKKLKEKGVLFGNRNEPKQKFIDAGYFELTEKFIDRVEHPGFVVTKVLVTQKGLAYINRLFNGSPSDGKVVAVK